MSKPRICEILGVKVNEVFRTQNINSAGEYVLCENVIVENGYEEGNYRLLIRLAGDSDWSYASTVDLIKLIENPKEIIHKLRWQNQDIEDAKAIKKLFHDDAYYVRRRMDESEITISNIAGETVMRTFSNFFDELKPGETVKLDDIIGGKGW